MSINELCLEPVDDITEEEPTIIEFPIDYAPEEDLRDFQLPDDEVDLLFPEEWRDGYFNGCDLAFPLEVFPPSDIPDPFGTLDLPESANATENKFNEQTKQTWWSKLIDKIDSIDWKEVDNKINTACVCCGWLLGKMLRVIIKILSYIFTSLFLICFISELTPGIRAHAPSFFFVIDSLLNWFDETIWRVIALPFK